MQYTQNATPNRRSAATQAAVDRFAAHPELKNARALVLAQEHGLTHAARVVDITRDAYGMVEAVIAVVSSQSDPTHLHVVVYTAPGAFTTDRCDCDCAAGVNGLACGHAGAGLLAGRAAADYLAIRLDSVSHDRATLIALPNGHRDGPTFL